MTLKKIQRNEMGTRHVRGLQVQERGLAYRRNDGEKINMKEKYKGQIEKLSEQLKKLNIPHTVKELFDGPDCIKFDWCDADIICHHFSYGGEDGLFEVMGKALMTTIEQKIDSVAGDIPMEDAVNRIKKAWDRNKNEVSKV